MTTIRDKHGNELEISDIETTMLLEAFRQYASDMREMVDSGSSKAWEDTKEAEEANSLSNKLDLFFLQQIL